MEIVYEILGKENLVQAVGYRGESTQIFIADTFKGVPVKRIGGYAFWGCVSVKTAYIPPFVEKIEERAFSGCENLERIVYGGRVSDWGFVVKELGWKRGAPVKEIICLDGVVKL